MHGVRPENEKCPETCREGCELWIYQQPVKFRHFMHELEYSEEFLKCHRCGRELKTLQFIRDNESRKKQAIDIFMSVA